MSPLESVLTPWGWKLVGDLEVGGPSDVQYTPSAEGVIMRENIPSAETIALAGAQPTITWEQNEMRAAEYTAQALEQGQAAADLREAVAETAAITRQTPGSTPTATPAANGKNGDMLILVGASLLALGFGRGLKRVKARRKRG